MAYFIWKEDLKTGVDEIDHQHRKIIFLLSKLHDVKDMAGGEAGNAIECIVEYIRYHLKFEEKFMCNIGLAQADEDRRERREFVYRLLKIRQRFRCGSISAAEAHGCFAMRIFSHIRSDTSSYRPSVSERGSESKLFSRRIKKLMLESQLVQRLSVFGGDFSLMGEVGRSFFLRWLRKGWFGTE